jgi:hypothetical protein
MTGIIALICMGLIVYGIRQTLSRSAPVEGPKCCVCRTTRRTLQWMTSWQDWYCWPCKEQCIKMILSAIIGERA